MSSSLPNKSVYGAAPEYDWECNPNWSECPTGQYPVKTPEPAVAPRKNLLNDFWGKNAFDIEEPETTTTTTTTEIPKTTYYVPETKPARPKFLRFPVKDHNETPSGRIHELVAFRDRTHKTAENNEKRVTEARDGYLSQDFALDRQKHHKDKSRAYVDRYSDKEPERDLKINSDVRTSYYVHGKDATEEDLGNVVRTETNDKSSGSPSITNIIDFRPLFNRLFHGDQDSDYENGYSIYGTTMPNLSPTFGPDYGLEKRNVAELRREIRRIKTMDERSARHSEEQAEPQSYVYPASYDPLQYKSTEGIPAARSALRRPLTIQNEEIRKHESHSNLADKSLRIQQKLARMIAVRNQLKHEKSKLQQKVDLFMKFFDSSDDSKSKMDLYNQLYAIDEESKHHKH